MSRTPEPEIIVDSKTVAQLVASQCPELAGRPVELLGHGWDNWLFRLGDQHIVRLPRRAVAVALLEHEIKCLPGLAPRLPIPIPVPVFCGTGDSSYRWPWLIAHRFGGDNADLDPPRPDQASRLAEFLLALHLPHRGMAPYNAHRGVALGQRHETMTSGWDVLAKRGEPIAPELSALWERACQAPADFEPVWLHGDLHYANVLVQAGAFTAIIDWGDICGGDPATDLASLWILFDDPAARRLGLASYGANADMIVRAMGWAISFGSVLLSTGLADNPRHAAVGRATLRRLQADLGLAQ
ncbi:MAG: aminoglycoside phosphotransferase family protein [Novosphingobium sp.]|uniref:aminoglycoside phosphotransferase family protein n=1 Tax=Novosphingobium sp. TaxID=1874826 RepID=UPI0032B9B77C